MKEMLKVALRYANHYKFSVIPVDKDKKPLIEWKAYQEEIASDAVIKAWFKKWPKANIGIVTGKISNVCVVDIDTPEGEEAFNAIAPDTLVTPMAHTPKGGKHYYFRCDGKYPKNNARSLEGCDFRGEGGYVVAWPSVNGNGKGWKFDRNLNITKKIAFLFKEYSTYISNNLLKSNIYALDKKDSKTDKDGTGQNGTVLFGEGSKDASLFHVANCLLKGGMREDNARIVLKNQVLSWDEPQSDLENDQWVNAKIESAMSRMERRERSIAEEVRTWVSGTKGDIDTTRVGHDLHIQDKRSKEALRKALQRLCVEGVLERNERRAGHYRIVNKDIKKIDFVNATENKVELYWPMNLHKLFYCQPKCIITVSGSPDSGKTAWLLNFVRMNMGFHKIDYLSSEMGDAEFKDRLSKFEGLGLDEWTFNAVEKPSDWWDVVNPTGITIIDYMEIHDNFYLVGDWITKCFNKLTTGVCIIALQKNNNADLGRGGVGTIEKARLAINLDHGVAKIVKAKNWVDPKTPPRGMQYHYKIVQGCKIIQELDWYKPQIGG